MVHARWKLIRLHKLEEAAFEAMLSDETPETSEARLVAKLGANALDEIERYTTIAGDPGFRPMATSHFG